MIYDLCAGTGSWSKPYVNRGYRVIQVDIKEDIRLLTLPDEPVHGILAAPPCTVFASSGARWPRSTSDMLGGLSVVDACLRFIVAAKPKWWALENPVGKLVRYLGPPVFRFDPCDYGDPYTKRTCLWGSFTVPSFKIVLPSEGSKMHTSYGGKSDQTKKMRSATPSGFARAFQKANP